MNYSNQLRELERLVNRTPAQVKEDEKRVEQEIDLEFKSIHFWHLQLQFLASFPKSVALSYASYIASDMYKANSFTSNVINITAKISAGYEVPHKDFECLCTHFALQLAGIEE